MHVDPRLADAAGHAADQGAGVAPVAGAGRAADDDRGGIVRLHAAVEQVQWLANDPARQHSLDRYALFVIGLWVIGGMRAVGRAHRGYLRRRGAEIIHVPQEGEAEELARALPTVGP